MGESNIKPDFIDKSGDKWQEFVVHHHGLKKWMDITGETDITKSPYWGATANEIDHIQTVKIQAVAQKWLEHSISKTCNLPHSCLVLGSLI
jgi:ribonucleoside-diphosphate reductase alpha chain